MIIIESILECSQRVLQSSKYNCAYTASESMIRELRRWQASMQYWREIIDGCKKKMQDVQLAIKKYPDRSFKFEIDEIEGERKEAQAGLDELMELKPKPFG